MTIAVLGTMDTKGPEAAYLKQLIEARGHNALLVDVGPLGPPGTSPQVQSSRIAELAGSSLEELLRDGRRERIMEAMGRGAGRLLVQLLGEGGLQGVIGLGGNQGTAIAAAAMRALPLGFPKFLVSTVASGNLRPYVGHKDIAVMFSVSDLFGGPNTVSAAILANAASALLGMVEQGGQICAGSPERTIAITALGNTEKAVSHAAKLLKESGFEPVGFHASGAGGSAMEELVAAGAIGGVLDITPHELAEEVAGAGIYAPVVPGRLTAAGRKGVPQVVSTGSLEYLCFGPRESIPPRLRRRRTYMHNPYNANVKLSRGEMKRVGQVMAERLNQARGPAAVLVPARGWSVYGSRGGPLHDPGGNRALLDALQRGLRSGIPCTLVDAHINDPGFAGACVQTMVGLMREHRRTA